MTRKMLALHPFLWYLSWATVEQPPESVGTEEPHHCHEDGVESCVQDATLLLLQTSLSAASSNTQVAHITNKHRSQIAVWEARSNRSKEALQIPNLSASRTATAHIIPVKEIAELDMVISLLSISMLVWLIYKLSMSNLSLGPSKRSLAPEEGDPKNNGFVAEGPCTIIAWCMLALLMFGLGIHGFHEWVRLELLTAPAIRGLTAWTIFIPIGIVLSLTASLGILTSPRISRLSKNVWLLLLAICWASAITAGVALARATLLCGVVFCFGEQPMESLQADWGLYLILIGAVFFVGLVLMCPSMNKIDGRVAHETFGRRMRSRKAAEFGSGLCLSLLVLPILFLLTTILPNSSRHFSPSDISEFMAMNVTTAEFQDAWLVTMNVRLSDTVVLKIFPDTVIFYSFLEVLAITAVAANMFPSFGKYLNHKRDPTGFTIGEKIAMALFSILLFLWVHYWLLDHSYHDGKETIDLWWWERIARTWGQTAVLFMSLLLLPASKNSLWLKCMGISWERSLWLHRWLGYATLICIAGHILSFWARYAELGCFPYDAIATVLYYPINNENLTRSESAGYENWTIGQQEMIAYPAIFMIGIGALARRKNWELFKYFHFVFLFLIPAVLVHAASAPYFMLGGVAFWLVDAAIRFATVVTPPACLLEDGIITHEAEEGFTELRMNWTHSEPGQFAWLKVSSISAWEWHPFSLSSGIDDGFAQMCIKNMGPGTWTDKLYQLGKEASLRSTTFDIQIDGPYGPYLEMDTHGARLLIAGGIGITQVHSIFRSIAQLTTRGESFRQQVESVHLVWIGKTRELFKVFGHSLKECVNSSTDGLQLSVTYFQTQPGPYESPDEFLTTSFAPEIKFSFGRPKFAQLYADETKALGGKLLLVQACGPEAMIEAAADGARGNEQVEFESMLFTL